LFGPEQQAVIDHKDTDCEKRNGHPLTAGWGRRTLQAHPCEERGTSNEETHAGEKKGRDLTHAYANGEEGRAPDEINNGEGQQGLPCGRTNRGFHGK